jgi:electron transfer flavoprotein alpha/beta subunit
MTRIAAIVGSTSPAPGFGPPTLPMSDRGAIALATARFASDVCVYAADPDARCFARAAGVEAVEEISDPEMGAADVILIGRGGCAESGDLLPARLAEESGAALVYEVIDVQRETGRLMVTRDLGRGARDLVSVRGRAVLVVAENFERGPYVSRYRMSAAKAAGSESVVRHKSGGESATREEPERFGWEPARPRVRLGDHAARVAGSAVERMNALLGVGEIAENTASLVRGSAEECARHLLRYLSHHGFVDRELGGEWESAPDEAERSQPTRQQTRRSEAGTASAPIRLRRRPRALHQGTLATRGPFEVGVDI